MYKVSQYFPKPYDRFGGNIKVELDLSNSVTKADLKVTTWVDTSNLTAKSDLSSLKSEIDKKDVDKLKIVSVDLIVYNKLATKVNATDTSKFVLKTKYDTDKSYLLKKIPNISGLVKKQNVMLKLMK